MSRVDLVARSGAMLSMIDDEFVGDALIAVDKGRIVYAGSAQAAPDSYVSEKEIGGSRYLAMPGIVNAHTHVGAHCYGTLCEEANILDSMYSFLFAAQARLDASLMSAFAGLGLWDALRSGVTTICDHWGYPSSTATMCRKLGMRAVIADEILEFDVAGDLGYEPGQQRYSMAYDRGRARALLERNIEFVQEWRNEPLITPFLGPHAPDTLSTEMLIECAQAAEALDTRMLIHVAQSRPELAQIEEKGWIGSVRYLSSIGFLSWRVHAAHMVYLEPEELDLVKSSGMSMSFNPIPMLACGGFPPIAELRKRGVPMGMGTDCFSMDLLQEMRYAIYLANYLDQDPTNRLQAADVLRMATFEGAACLGLGEACGTLETGKKADFILLDMNDPRLIPATSHAEAVAYYADARNVRYSVIDGEIVLADGRLTRADEEELASEASEAAKRWLSANRDVFGSAGLLRRIDAAWLETCTAERNTNAD